MQENVSPAGLLRQCAPANALDLFFAAVNPPLVLVSAALARIKGDRVAARIQIPGLNAVDESLGWLRDLITGALEFG